MEQESSKLVQVYINDDTLPYDIAGGIGSYQSLSRLLYCNQLQLNETEYFMSSGMATVNVTDPMIFISDYYKVSPSQIRVCVDAYLRKSKGKTKTSDGAFTRMSIWLLFSSLVLVTFIGTENFYRQFTTFCT